MMSVYFCARKVIFACILEILRKNRVLWQISREEHLCRLNGTTVLDKIDKMFACGRNPQHVFSVSLAEMKVLYRFLSIFGFSTYRRSAGCQKAVRCRSLVCSSLNSFHTPTDLSQRLSCRWPRHTLQQQLSPVQQNGHGHDSPF